VCKTEDYNDYRPNCEVAYKNSHYSWLVNNQNWWTQFAYSTYSFKVHYVAFDGAVKACDYNNYNASQPNNWLESGIRPVITISKETLKGL
jgi:hypothetical protein